MLVTVVSQVAVLMLMIAVGFVAAKVGIMTEEGAACCTDIALIIATPCVIVKSFIREYSTEIMRSMLLAFGLTLLVQLVMIILGRILLRAEKPEEQRVLRFGAVFANCGFMSLPLQQVMLGAEGTLYGSAYVVMFNLVLWSYGVYSISGDKGRISLKKLLLNPGLAGLCVGVIIFAFSIPVPSVIASAIDYIAALYTPLPMLIIGYRLSRSKVLKAVKDSRCIAAVLLRLIAFPLVSLGLLYLLGVRGTLLVSVIISVSAPVAAVTTMFSTKFGGGDTELSVNMVSLSTVLSAVTMPAIVYLASIAA